MIMEGQALRTRLTERIGIVVRHEADRGVAVLWADGRSTTLHPEVEVDIVPGVFERREDA
jgi:hypothetical protein